MTRLVAVLVVLPMLAACNAQDNGGRSPGHVEEHIDPGVWQIAETLTGSFSSAAQAEADPENYSDIRLNAVRIWGGRDDNDGDARWLYVEQAAADALDQPYRQRVYHITFERSGGYRSGGYRSDIYTLPGDPLRFAGGWEDPSVFYDLSPDSLTLREGCSVILRRTGPGEYAGSTEVGTCPSDLRGASYATSEVVIESRDRFTSWDRGFDADSQQVWGATEGPYVFERVIAED